ncbi:cache domain-containing protein, partial [Pararhodospirillum oryzae]|uniref:cache domain-containing protein n=1 Tax=Pararhodospirillum oryzae TaxID=478448 RepID=UPI00147876C4
MSLKVPLGARIALPVVLMALAMMLLVGIALQRQKDSILQERRALLQEHVSSAISIISSLHEQSEKGEISQDEARERSKNIIRSINFGDGDYVFINDRQGLSVVNRGAPQAEGKDFSQTKDANGFPYFRAMIDRTANNQSAFVEYEWPHPGAEKPAPKLTYVAPFAPWGWIVGTGVYLDDLEDMMMDQAMGFLLIGLVILAATTGVSTVVVRTVSGPLRAMTGAMTRLARGDLAVSIDGGQRGDEIGAMAHALEVFRDNARENKRLGEEAKAAEVRLHEDQRQARIALAQA